MLKYLAKRIARSFITLFIVITIVFSLLRLMPIEGYFNNYEKMSPQQIERELTRMGLTDPLPVQLLNFYKDLLHGDLGNSNKYRPGISITEIHLSCLWSCFHDSVPASGHSSGRRHGPVQE